MTPTVSVRTSHLLSVGEGIVLLLLHMKLLSNQLHYTMHMELLGEVCGLWLCLIKLNYQF